MASDEGYEALRSALEEVAGAALVLDPELRVVGVTSEAEELVGVSVPVGVPAVKILCGAGEQRPIAEAMAEGRPATAHVSRPTERGDRLLHVRAIPLAPKGERVGWLLLLTDTGADDDRTVEVHGILTRDPAMKRLLRDVRKVARSDSNVLVRGETGAGKELIARALHAESTRSDGPFRAINCAALPAQLLESELFGHVRGAFTGAVRDHEGHLRLAQGGTFFLDEVAELPLELQAKLLRVLQERTVLPVGGRTAFPIDVRFVAATHRSLRRAVEDGRFRADLMYRLRVIPLFLPPLRDRPADVGLLAERFIKGHNEKGARTVSRIAPGALRAMEAYDWPGNVRELQNAVEYAHVIGEGEVLTEAELPPEVRGEQPGAPPVANSGRSGADESLPPEARRIVHALERAAGNRARAAEMLGISRTTLWRKLRNYGLDADEI